MCMWRYGEWWMKGAEGALPEGGAKVATRPTARKTLGAEGMIGGALKARKKAQASRNTNVPCRVKIG